MSDYTPQFILEEQRIERRSKQGWDKLGKNLAKMVGTNTVDEARTELFRRDFDPINEAARIAVEQDLAKQEEERMSNHD